MIRLARLDDLPAITRVRTSVRENHLSVEQLAARGITEATVAAAMHSGELVAWVSEEAQSIVAFAMLELVTGKLFALFTHPDHEGQGYGSALLRKSETHLRTLGRSKMVLDTGGGTAAVAFYAKRGFAVMSVRDGDVIMSKAVV